MKKILFLVLAAALIFSSCVKKDDTQGTVLEGNPFFSDYGTPFETPPFDRITTDHYLPAFRKGMEEQKAELEAFIGSSEAPTFANTIEVLEYSGALLTRVGGVFDNLNSSLTGEEMQRIAEEIAPELSKHADDISLNPELFERIKVVYDSRDGLGLNTEQFKLLDQYYKGFVRSGALLDENQKDRFREINEELSLLSLRFGKNVLDETNTFRMVIESEADLAGLPPTVISASSEAAADAGLEGKWIFTLHKPSLIPFLQYAENRTLREKIYTASFNVGNNDNEYDNKAVAARMAALRVERANLLGYDTHAHFVLEENMARVPENVFGLLDQLFTPALNMAKAERAEMQALIDEEGGGFNLQPWDWWYYAEKFKKAKYDLDEESLRPYFQLENVIDGVFAVAGKLWGLQFEQRDDIPKYHPDVKVFEVKEEDGTHIGILYADYFPRASKRGGAWMNAFRKQYRQGGVNITPVIVNCGNFSKPTADTPSLISMEEALTLFHEFGHALHGLLSDRTYPSLTGTDVPRDFVELPSQIMENWGGHPEVLKMYARHYKTGEPIPDDLLEKVRKSKLFNRGFAETEYLAACYLDMDWHTLKSPEEKDCLTFEKASLDRIGLIPEIIVRYRTPYFRHIFAGGYSAGYYSYVWAEVLDADAFEAFKEKGLFDRETAGKFREHVLSAGGTDDPMVLYKRFRGAEPKVDALLKRKGFLK